MRILGIETSCDETAISIVSGRKNQLRVEKSVVLSQIQTHQQYGGVVPEVAARKHIEAIFPMLEKELSKDGKGIDVIAVTAGPGLAPALRTGVETAKTLAWLWGKPLVPICHLEGHIYASWLPKAKRLLPFWPIKTPQFPALCLIVSGGHSELIIMKDHEKFERIGETLDDAAGEAFDKVAKMLGLKYPGGPEIAKLALYGDNTKFNFPRGLLDRPNYDFSFSGVKTSVLYTLRKMTEAPLESPHSWGEISVQDKADVAASFQEAVVDVLVRKTMRAAKEHKPKSIILAGGVAANIELRKRLQEKGVEAGIKVFVPPFTYSLDNAAMIAAAGYFRAQNKENFVEPASLSADPNLDLI